MGNTAALQLVAIVRSAELEHQVRKALSQAGIAGAVIRSGLADARARLPKEAPRHWLIDVDAGDQRQLAEAEDFVAGPGGGAVVIATTRDPAISGIRALMRLGIADILPQPVTAEDLAAALCAPGATARGSEKPACVLSFIKGGGGSGATTLAAQMACSFGRPDKGEPTACLIDFDLQFGSAAYHLDVPQRHSVLDLLADLERLDGSMLRGAMARHSSGIHVLPAPTVIQPLDLVSPEGAQRVVDVARREYETILLDLPLVWNAWSRNLLSVSTNIVLVMQPTVPSIRHARRQLDVLEEEGLGELPLTVIANRVDPRMFPRTVPLKEAEKALGRKIDHVIEDHGYVMTDAVNIGRRLSETRGGKKVAAQLGVIAQKVTSHLIDAAAPARA